MTKILKELINKISGLSHTPEGAHNIRVNGSPQSTASTKNIKITPKENNSGIDITIKPNIIGETVYIPVVISESGLVEAVYNDFYIGEGCDVTIIAGCAIHNDADTSQHDGIHTFHIGKNARVQYFEKHYGSGDKNSSRIMNPITNVFLESGSHMHMDTDQIEGVTSTKRSTNVKLKENSTFIASERIMTTGSQIAQTYFDVELNGKDSSTTVSSRSVAKDHSLQEFFSNIRGNAPCFGHSECDAIIMDKARVNALPEIRAKDVDAQLIHEAAIGKIATDQIIKLMSLGLTKDEAEEQIIKSFLN